MPTSIFAAIGASECSSREGVSSAAVLSNVQVYVDAELGNDVNPGTITAPVRTGARALSMLPLTWTGKCRIHVMGTTPVEWPDTAEVGRPMVRGEPLTIMGEDMTPVTGSDPSIPSGTRTIEVVTSGPAMQIQDADVALGMTEGAWAGYYLRFLDGPQQGQRYVIRWNTSNTFITFNGTLELGDPVVGNTYVIESPTGSVNLSTQSLMRNQWIAFKDLNINAMAGLTLYGTTELWLESCWLGGPGTLDLENNAQLVIGCISNLAGYNLFSDFSTTEPGCGGLFLTNYMALSAQPGSDVDMNGLVVRSSCYLFANGSNVSVVLADIRSWATNCIVLAGGATFLLGGGGDTSYIEPTLSPGFPDPRPLPRLLLGGIPIPRPPIRPRPRPWPPRPPFPPRRTRGGGILCYQDAHLILDTVDLSVCNHAAAVQVDDAHCTILNSLTGISNTGFGIKATNGSRIHYPSGGTVTITGASGELFVDDLVAAHADASTGVISPATKARIDAGTITGLNFTDTTGMAEDSQIANTVRGRSWIGDTHTSVWVANSLCRSTSTMTGVSNTTGITVESVVAGVNGFTINLTAASSGSTYVGWELFTQ